jgi:hypothetical protein
VVKHEQEVASIESFNDEALDVRVRRIVESDDLRDVREDSLNARVVALLCAMPTSVDPKALGEGSMAVARCQRPPDRLGDQLSLADTGPSVHQQRGVFTTEKALDESLDVLVPTHERTFHVRNTKPMLFQGASHAPRSRVWHGNDLRAWSILVAPRGRENEPDERADDEPGDARD